LKNVGIIKQFTVIIDFHSGIYGSQWLPSTVFVELNMVLMASKMVKKKTFRILLLSKTEVLERYI